MLCLLKIYLNRLVKEILYSVSTQGTTTNRTTPYIWGSAVCLLLLTQLIGLLNYLLLSLHHMTC